MCNQALRLLNLFEFYFREERTLQYISREILGDLVIFFGFSPNKAGGILHGCQYLCVRFIYGATPRTKYQDLPRLSHELRGCGGPATSASSKFNYGPSRRPPCS